ncbi:MAG: helix-turn-helix domain-containing protein [Rhodocyclaceae bacterium]|nr:helix-turn-helix domain-containing protein [Rhodocyclaceae bacterium]
MLYENNEHGLQPRDEDVSRRLDKAIGDELRNIRRELRLTQQQLADQLGLSFQQIQKYEKGTNRLSVSRACMLAPALNMTPAALLERLSQSTTTILVELSYSMPLGKRPPALEVALSGIHSDAVRRALTSLIRRLMVTSNDKTIG